MNEPVQRVWTRTIVRALTWAAAMNIGTAVANAQTPPADLQAPSTPPAFTESIDVVDTTPMHGLAIDRNKIPGNVQAVTADTLARTGGISFAEQLNLGVSSVHINDATTNPFQPDVQFRGFVGSPLLGLPQGLAVYQNGVRLNEPFGDTVNWDMVPTNAIASVNLMPGSNPLFGLNALGGAISMQTKTGFSHTGHDATISGGSFGRYLVEGSTGGNKGPLGYFLAGQALTENGWREFSPSKVRQLFGDVEWRNGATMVNGTINTVANSLIGNGPAPIQLLEGDRSAIFTYPDETETTSTLVTLRARHNRASTVDFESLFYYRRAAIDTFNGDDSDYDECEDENFEELLCTDEGDGERVIDQFGEFIGAGDDDELNGTNNTSQRVSNGWGGTLQATVVKPLSGRPNQFVTGITFDAGGTDYEADTEIARLTEERGTVGVGLLDSEASVRLRTTVRHTGFYAANFFTVAPNVTVMGAARFNHSSVTLRDRLGTDLNGDHSFSRLNPAAGITWDVRPDANVYASFSMSSRVPAPSELSCADPEDPCRLPNAFVADPPLEQVVASTLEAGIRGRRADVSWNASFFRTAASDDILFISSGPLTNTGHFQNIGDTSRQGLELGASGVASAVRWGIAYAFVSARFDSKLTLSSPNHPDEEGGEIEVEEGSRIPGVPQHNLKLNLSSTIGRLSISGSLHATSSQYLRGDEANLLDPIDGFGVVNVSASYAVASNVSLTARVTNLLDTEYSTFGLLGEADEVLGDDYQDPQFLGPGAPRAAWVGLRVSFR